MNKKVLLSSILCIGILHSQPLPPVLSAPGSSSGPGPTVSTLTPTFTWSASTGATGYGLYIRNQTTNTLVYDNDNVPNSTSLTLPSGVLVNGNQYRWNMRAKNASGWGEYTTGYLYFQTISENTVGVSLLGPGFSEYPGELISTTSPLFQWTSSSSVSTYKLYLNQHPFGIENNIYVKNNISDTSFQISNNVLVPGKVYQWNVTAILEGGDSISSNSLIFRTAMQPPSDLLFAFPLKGLNPYSAPIVSIFDHSMPIRYCPDSLIVTFTGEKGIVKSEAEPPVPGACGMLYSYKKEDNSDFLTVINYKGTILTGKKTINYDGHPGYDYAISIGQDVYSAADGFVEIAEKEASTSSGKYIRVRHQNGIVTQYLHLSEILVNKDDSVKTKQLIGKSGNTGNVAPHLHFEVKLDDVPIDPYGWTGQGDDPYTISTGIINKKMWADEPLTPVSKTSTQNPSRSLLRQNYPNPFNSSTTIEFDMHIEGVCRITILDAIGRVVMTLVDDIRPAGSYKLSWNANALSSGIYFYRLQTKNIMETKVLTLVK